MKVYNNVPTFLSHHSLIINPIHLNHRSN